MENIYQDPVHTTESSYESIKLKQPGKKKHAVGPFSTQKGSQRFVIFLLSINTLLLVITLGIVGVHYSQSQADNTHLAGYDQVRPLLKQNGHWHLRDNIFYLFWHGHGDCQAAERFCSEQNATLATTHEHNRNWMITLAHGKQMWVNEGSDDSGSGLSQDEEACSCRLLEPDPLAATECEDFHSWVCERSTIQRAPEFPDFDYLNWAK
ncbi:uncharacterized protein LOC133133007 [Conger conger]|uniref:uncharacterized protein LOC133133007 n=1 Tax=Conger conger TaxID=82655 RepID=UPI002A5AAE6B|nr:uncharacterized protein LOC133133007 [Conger conger]